MRSHPDCHCPASGCRQPTGRSRGTPGRWAGPAWTGTAFVSSGTVPRPHHQPDHIGTGMYCLVVRRRLRTHKHLARGQTSTQKQSTRTTYQWASLRGVHQSEAGAEVRAGNDGDDCATHHTLVGMGHLRRPRTKDNTCGTDTGLNCSVGRTRWRVRRLVAQRGVCQGDGPLRDGQVGQSHGQGCHSDDAVPHCTRIARTQGGRVHEHSMPVAWGILTHVPATQSLPGMLAYAGCPDR